VIATAATPVRGYQVRLQCVRVAGGEDLHVRALLDCQQYADPDGGADAAGISAANWPLFGQIWPSSQKLADLMQGYAFGERRILETGCGLALASLVIHRRGGNVTASDCHPLTETFLRANLRLNGLDDLVYRTGHWQRVNPELGKFDLIIGSDLLYERSQPGQLAAFIQVHAAERAEVLIVDPDRGNRSAFHLSMKQVGFGLTETTLDKPLSDGSPYRGRLMHYRRESRSRASSVG
jgi:2-polyprenyl-3-methyl-5-hydroxy-6-metoxy-1,4-benzoquinol methylase